MIDQLPARATWLIRLLIFTTCALGAIAILTHISDYLLNKYSIHDAIYHITQSFLSLAFAGWALTELIPRKWMDIKRTILIALIINTTAIIYILIPAFKDRINFDDFTIRTDKNRILASQYGIALNQYTQDCMKNDATSCSNLGVMYEKGYGVEINNDHAYSLYSKACDLNSAVGCRRLGFMYIFGITVQPNVSKEQQLFTKACTLGDNDACTTLHTLDTQ